MHAETSGLATPFITLQSRYDTSQNMIWNMVTSRPFTVQGFKKNKSYRPRSIMSEENQPARGNSKKTKFILLGEPDGDESPSLTKV